MVPCTVRCDCVENDRIADFVDDIELLDAQLLDPIDGVTHLAPGADDFLAAFLIDDRGNHVHLRLQAADLDDFRLVKFADDCLVRAVLFVHGPQEHRRGDFAGLVDPYREDVFLGDVDFDPTAALGDDAAGVKGPVAFRLFLDKVHAR